ncbi:MAG: hypothetical protein LBR17_05920 [Bacteroidales bacterium]|jgi:hypothetical protein|nr:hypothetical protein [Bacteroidales bacterium]
MYYRGKNEEKLLQLYDMYKSYTVEELENIVTEYRHRACEEREAALHVRKWKLDNTFEWTPENKEKLLFLNEKLIECFEKLKTEACALYKALQQRVAENDGFLDDFFIEARIIPSVFKLDDEGNVISEMEYIYEVLHYEWNSCINLSFIMYRENMNETDILYLNREQNWNTDPWLKGQFDEHFISQGIHDLYEHTEWILRDILEINYLDVSLDVIYEHIVELRNE